VIVNGGVVQVLREGRGSYEVTDINGQVDLKTLNNMAGKVTLTLADGSKLAGEAAIRELVSQGELKPQNASGSLRLTTDRNASIGPLAALAGQAGLKGGVNLDVNAVLDAGKLEGQFALGVAGLQSAQRAAADAAPLNAKLQGQMHWADGHLTGNAELVGDAGRAQAELTYEPSDQPLNVTADQVVSAMLTGRSVTLPDFAVHAQASIDLAKLGRAAPELLKVREGAELTGGKLELTNLTIQGGAKPVANAAIELKELAVRRGDQPVRFAPIAFNLDSALEAGQGLRVRQLALTSNFAQVNGSGLASDLHADFKADLGQLQRELGQVFELGAFELAGKVNGAVDLQRASDEQVDVGLQATAEEFRCASGGRTFELPRAKVTETGQFVLAQQKLTKVSAQQIKADLNGEIVASASGSYDLQQKGLRADIDVSRGDLAFVASRAQALGVGGLSRYSGGLHARARLDRAAGGQPLETRGELVVQNFGADGKPVAEGDTKVKWDGVQLAPDGKSVQAALVRLESTLARLTARDVKWKSGDRLALEGKVEAEADVARCLNAAAPVANWEKPPELAGRLTLSTSGAAAGDLLTLVGQGGIEQFVIGRGAAATREENVQFTYDAKLDQGKQSVVIKKCSLASKPLTAEVSGMIGQYAGDCQLDLHGRYSTSWEAITALLHQLVPSTASTVMLAGNSSSEFKITGPARQAGLRPSFRGVSAGTDVSWTSAELYGVKLGMARLAPAVKEGQMIVPTTAIPAGDGKVNLGAIIDFQAPDPTLKMPGQTTLLENVAVTKELGAQLLSRINPIFLYVANIQGRANLGVRDVLAPLGESIKQRGAGQGRLALSQMKMQPSGIFAELLSLAGMPKDAAYPVRLGALDFVLKDGRIVYDNFTLTFPGELDLKFRGSVGLDETLDLVVSVPVGAALLDRLGAKGPTQEYAQMLRGTRVDIPLIGTREEPRLDFSQVDVQALLKNILTKEQPVKQIEDFLKGLHGEKKNEKKKP
jgi:hypothetical protein